MEGDRGGGVVNLKQPNACLGKDAIYKDQNKWLYFHLESLMN